MLLKPRRPATLGPVSKHLWSAQGAAAPTLQMPLRETQRLQCIAPDGTLQEGELSSTTNRFPRLIFSTGSIIPPSYSEKPQVPMHFLESIFQTHCPTWVDCRQLLLTLFNAEEHKLVES